ncbi:hypothetical protein C1H46_001045 [Malus baccata]|uniref:Glycerol-3-phosphate dehydrogenase NAD-dependent N-terminal domain-containing protein n=1 Tax=Malus baccata TaxID=106549 RepID=A0A540NR06_MALBA|nr:hypothetical protein C1H46_001045 [Malus baccata]
MATLLEPPPPFLNQLLLPNSTSTRPIPYNLRLGKPTNSPNHPTLIAATTPCCSAATSEQPIPQLPDPVPETALVRTRDRRGAVRLAWEKLVRWSRTWRSKTKTDVLEHTNKVVVLRGGSFATTMASHVANRKSQMEVSILFSSSFLEGIVEHVYPSLPFISVNKGLELNMLRTMSQIIPQALKNPTEIMPGSALWKRR